jgi:hypothetical protein
VVVDNQGNTVKSPGEVLTMAKLDVFSLDGILKIEPATVTVFIGNEVRLNVESDVLATETLTGLKAIPTSLVDRDTIPTCWDVNTTPAPERKDTPVADNDVPTNGGNPVLAADKRFVWKV